MDVSPSSYASVFQEYLAISVEQDITAVQACVWLTDDVRDQALHTLEYALKRYDGWTSTVALLLALAPLMERAGYRTAWEPFLEEALRQSESRQDSLATARIRFQLGVLCQRQARFSKAQHYFEQSLDGLRAEGTEAEYARALSALADILRRARQFTQASRLIAEAFGLTLENRQERAYAAIIKGAIAYDQRLWHDAHDAFQKALAFQLPQEALREKAWALTNLGATYQRLVQPLQAIACFTEALPLLEALQDVVFISTTYMNLGNAYLSIDNSEAALSFYTQAESGFARAHAWQGLASTTVNQGMAYSQLGLWHKAESAYRKSIELWQTLENAYQEANVLDGLGQIYAAQGRHDDAAACFLRGITLLEENPDYEHLRLSLKANHGQVSVPLAQGELDIGVPYNEE
jgi:tetratricopeptide (TPR) repeat protein